MASEAQITRLKELIAIQLDMCSKEDWPYVCNMANTPEGKKDVENKIIHICTTSESTVGQALDRIERMFNPNRIDD
jgi:hypothetical protein